MTKEAQSSGTMNESWKRWYFHNLANGIPKETLIDVLFQRGISLGLMEATTPTGKSLFCDKEKSNTLQADQLNGDWAQWVRRNIERGVLEKTLIEAVASDIRTAWTQRNEELRNQSELQGYRYECAPKLDAKATEIDGLEINISLKMDKPKIILFENVLSKEECENLIQLAENKLSPSCTHDSATAQLVVRDFRKSRGAFLKRDQNELIRKIERRIERLTQWPSSHSEELQILNYREGGEYRPHFDFFPPEIPTSRISLNNGGQRVATLILYLNAVEDGGETFFPKINLKIKPRPGSALYFSYTNQFGELDRLTLHGGAPVIKGEKWIATRWMRQCERS